MVKLIKKIQTFVKEAFSKTIKYERISYSQEGEDIILQNIFGNKESGFYVDVGAFHPFRFSNTYTFYKKGWRGINIDATPDSMDKFNKHRPRDFNIEAAISDSINELEFFVFDEQALNSFSKNISNKRNKNTNYKIKKTIKLAPQKLSKIIDKYLPKNTSIDFLSIDVEGHEYNVLNSNDWGKYKPSYILIEVLKTKPSDLVKNKTYRFLKSKHYELIAFTGRTAIFKRK